MINEAAVFDDYAPQRQPVGDPRPGRWEFSDPPSAGHPADQGNDRQRRFNFWVHTGWTDPAENRNARIFSSCRAPEHLQRQGHPPTQSQLPRGIQAGTVKRRSSTRAARKHWEIGPIRVVPRRSADSSKRVRPPANPESGRGRRRSGSNSWIQRFSKRQRSTASAASLLDIPTRAGPMASSTIRAKIRDRNSVSFRIVSRSNERRQQPCPGRVQPGSCSHDLVAS